MTSANNSIRILPISVVPTLMSRKTWRGKQFFNFQNDCKQKFRPRIVCLNFIQFLTTGLFWLLNWLWIWVQFGMLSMVALRCRYFSQNSEYSQNVFFAFPVYFFDAFHLNLARSPTSSKTLDSTSFCASSKRNLLNLTSRKVVSRYFIFHLWSRSVSLFIYIRQLSKGSC